MHKIQNTRSISYAGAYLKYGFHEDGFTSGLLAACSIDGDSRANLSAAPRTNRTIRPPFDIKDADHHVALRRRGSDTISWQIAAFIFSSLEKSGIRNACGIIGTLVLEIMGFLLGIKSL